MATWQDRLASEMAEKNIGPADLSKLSGVPPDLISKYRRALVDSPRGDSLERLAAALQLKLAWLLTGEGEKYAPVNQSLRTVTGTLPGGGDQATTGRENMGDEIEWLRRFVWRLDDRVRTLEDELAAARRPQRGPKREES